MAIDLTELGITPEELLDRVVQRIAEGALCRYIPDDEEGEVEVPTALKRLLDQKVRAVVDAAIDRVAEKYLVPKIAQGIEAVTFEATNRWGEKTGEPMTFREYLISRAEAYMLEEVDFEGKTKEQNYGYSFKKEGTRIGQMINQHLHYSIESAMKGALRVANDAIANGITETVKIQLQRIIDGIRAKVEIPR